MIRRAGLCAAVLVVWVPPAGAGAVTVVNHKDATTIRYPVPLLRGRLTDTKATSVEIVNESSKRPTRKMTCLAYKGRFVGLAELVAGRNRLVIRCGKDTRTLTITYKPQTNPYIVRVFYLTDKSGRTDYQTPLPDDPQDYAAKLATAMTLMQTFTAERMHDAGHGRVTFRLQRDDRGEVKVHTLRGTMSVREYHKLSGQQLWQHAWGLINRRMPDVKARNLVIPAFTHFDAKSGKLYSHTALGGGAFALFGGGNLFTWPSALGDVQRALMDARRIDPKRFFSDSVGRHTFWATASTTIGAALHELGHTFGLPHTRHPHDIMTRGIDRLNRVFTLVEPPHARRGEAYEFKSNEVALWAPVSAAWLKYTRWLALDKRAFAARDLTAIELDRRAGKIVVESPVGIGTVTFGPHDAVLFAVTVNPAQPVPKRLELPLGHYGKYLQSDTAAIRVIDVDGQARAVRMKMLLAGPFVRVWRLASVMLPWPSPQSFPAVDEAKLRDIAASAEKAMLTRSASRVVDFTEHFPPGKRAYLAAYAVRKIHCDAPRTVQIHAGSDDALRVWVNGKPVIRTLALRSAVIDQDTGLAELRKGENTLIAEVSQATGDWALVLRLTDAAGGRLLLTDAGRLVKAADVPAP